MRFVEKKKKKLKKKKRLAESLDSAPVHSSWGLHHLSSTPPSSPRTSALDGLFSPMCRCILPRYFSVSVSSAPKITCLPLLDLLVALQPPNTQGFKKSDELAVSWTISISLKAEIFLPLCISQWKPTVLRLPLSLQTCFYSVL